jgi:pyrroloquinoline quinone biosynthesis protein B|tara:strand:- start:716 stop:1699 length:984 start_codon:yes stop_codon:yes gene_type:complete
MNMGFRHMKLQLLFLSFLLQIGCNTIKSDPDQKDTLTTVVSETSLVVLGTIQDAGSPHIACKKACCENLFEKSNPLRKVVSLGIIDPQNNKSFLFEATPDMTSQVKKLKQFSNSENELPDGIFLSHAHIGHYTGLMYLGKEATNANQVPVYAMPRMKNFLENNGPWSQLVSTNNIAIQEIANHKEIELTSNIKVIPFTVPHRDEFSETVGFKIIGPKKSVLFIPDIDKWEKWETDISEAISEVDFAFVDATFFDGEEINTRDISEIPHPFVIESMEHFKRLPSEEKQKIHFIHFNHTNPVLNSESEAYKTVINNGFNIAQIDMIISL